MNNNEVALQLISKVLEHRKLDSEKVAASGVEIVKIYNQILTDLENRPVSPKQYPTVR